MIILFNFLLQHIIISALQIINKNSLKRVPIYLGIFLCLLILFLNMGKIVGTDYSMYNDFFNKLLLQNKIPEFYIKDSGWGLMVYFYFIGKIFKDFRCAVFLLILFQLLVVYFILKKYSYTNLYYFSFLTYFSFFYSQNLFNAMKQGVAICLIGISINYILKRNLLIFLFFILIATLFHVLSISCIPIYFLLNNKIKIRYIVISFFISCFAVYFLKNNIFLIGNLFSNNMRYYQYFLGAFSNVKFNLLNFIEIYIPFLILLFLDFKYNLRNKTHKNKIFINMYYYYCFLYLITFIDKLMGYRFVIFLSMFFSIIYPYIYYKLFKYLKIKKLFYVFYPCLMLVFLYFRNIRLLF